MICYFFTIPKHSVNYYLFAVQRSDTRFFGSIMTESASAAQFPRDHI